MRARVLYYPLVLFLRDIRGEDSRAAGRYLIPPPHSSSQHCVVKYTCVRTRVDVHERVRRDRLSHEIRGGRNDWEWVCMGGYRRATKG